MWLWDITYLPSPVRGKFYYLYLIEDIYSRKAVGWEVYKAESGEKAAALLQRSVTQEQCWRQPLVLHSDNGAPMKSVTLLIKMYDLGINYYDRVVASTGKRKGQKDFVRLFLVPGMGHCLGGPGVTNIGQPFSADVPSAVHNDALMTLVA